MKYVKSIFIMAAICVVLYSVAATQDASTPATMGQDGVQRISVVGGSYFFKPSHVTVKVNVPVEMEVSKEWGIVPHDIIAKSPEAGIEFQEDLSSTPKVIKFTPTKVGTYPLYCDKKAPFSKSHREKGMEGVIEVVP